MLTNLAPHPALAWAINPAFFWAGAALVAVPIIIHILNRRRFRVVPWAAMEYLLQAMRKNRRRLKFEQWLLLATRCALLGLLGLALARPLGCAGDDPAAFAARRTGLHVFIIDNSHSMAYEAARTGAATHLDHAKNLATELIDRLLAGGESVAIITASRPAEAVVARPTHDLEAARSAVARIEQSHSRSDLPAAMQIALDLVQDHEAPTVKHLYIITDGTRSAWATPEAQALSRLGPELAQHYRMHHFHLGRSGQWNHAVLDVRPAGNLVTTRFVTDFLAAARGYGSGPDSLLQWRIDGQTVSGGATLRLDPETPPQVNSQIHFRSGGPHVITAALASDDRLPADNERHRIVDVISELKVLIVEGRRGVSLSESSGGFLELALAPPSEAPLPGAAPATASYVWPELISDLELGNKVLGEYGAVILAGVGQIHQAHADQLHRFVQQGGTLMLFMGDQVSRDNYNSVLLPRGLMPGPLVQRMNAGDDAGFLFDFSPEGLLHPLLHIFAGEQNTGLETAPIYTYWQVELPPDSPAERVLNYRGASDPAQQDPAITVHSLGSGRVVFISTTANHEWTHLPAKPVFVPLIHELLAGSIEAGDEWMNLEVGQRLEVPSRVQMTTIPVLIDPVRLELIMEQITRSDGRSVHRSEPLHRPGIYQLQTGRRAIAVAVNIPASEADVRTLDHAAIRAALGDIDLALHEDYLPVESAAQRHGADYGWTIMLIVLALLCTECFMAMRFGHYRREPKHAAARE